MSEVRRSTSCIRFRRLVPRSSSHIGPRFRDFVPISGTPSLFFNLVHAWGVVRQHSVLKRVLRRFWEGFWGRGSQKVPRRGLLWGFKVKKGSEKGSQKGFWEGSFQKVPRTPPWGVRPFRRAPYLILIFLSHFQVWGVSLLSCFVPPCARLAAAGIIYSLTAGQPLCIQGATGPELAYTIVFYNLCDSMDIEFLPARVWQGFWCAGASPKNLQWTSCDSNQARKRHINF